jgi:hypothetical protein
MLYRADPPTALIVEPLDTFTGVFHRPSGTTHLLVSPAPEILAVLGERAMTLDALLIMRWSTPILPRWPSG